MQLKYRILKLRELVDAVFLYEINESWTDSDTIILSTGADFPDALAGGPLAYQEDAPILLTRPGSLMSATEQEIKRLKPDKVIILGSTAAVSADVYKALPKPIRYGGATRFDIAKLISTKLPLGVEQAYVATGRNFPDALAGSVLAANNNASILLIKEKSIPSPTNEILPTYRDYSIFGSSGAVGNEVKYLIEQSLRNQKK